jgi:hypothetical protein
MKDMIGAKVLVHFEKVGVPCKVIDARQTYGRTDYKIEPEGGRYSQWVSEGRIIERI